MFIPNRSGGFQHTLYTAVEMGCNCIRSNPFFFGRCSSDGKIRDVGWATLFLSAVDSLSLIVSWGVELDPISVVSSTLEGDFTLEWVGITGITGGGKIAICFP